MSVKLFNFNIDKSIFEFLLINSQEFKIIKFIMSNTTTSALEKSNSLQRIKTFSEEEKHSTLSSILNNNLKEKVTYHNHSEQNGNVVNHRT
jgi:hypothetical protein